jgi:glycosyltransferase involved in cell wall biosynthesis
VSRVSAILLTYNCEAFVAEAIRSLLAQDYAGPVEVIVSDDASSDRSYDVACRELASCRSSWQVRLFRRTSNSGSKSAHLNDVLPRSSGDILVSFDADDVSEPSRIRRTVAAFSADPAVQAVYSSFSLIDNNGRDRGMGHVPHPPSNENTRRWFARVDAYAAGATLAVRRAVMEVFGPLRSDIHEDIVLPFRASLLGEAIYLDEPLVRYRRHAASMTADLDRFTSLAAYRRRMQQGIARARNHLASRRSDLLTAMNLMPKRAQDFAALNEIADRSLANAEMTAQLVAENFIPRISALFHLTRSGAYRDEWANHTALALMPGAYLFYKRRSLGVNRVS